MLILGSHPFLLILEQSNVTFAEKPFISDIKRTQAWPCHLILRKVPANVIHFRELFCWSPSLLESHMKASALFNNHFTWDICVYFYYNKNKIYFNMYLYNYTHLFSNNNTIINFFKNQLKVVSTAQSVWKLIFREKLCKSGRQFNQLHMHFCRIRSNNWSISPFSILGIVFQSKHRLDELYLWKILSFKVSLQSQ